MLSGQSLDNSFFFQAEDGIRDYKVTGVQTCALPISVRLTLRCAKISPSHVRQLVAFPPTTQDSFRCRSHSHLCPGHSLAGSGEQTRSEERRVGKECRSRWSPYH